MAGRHRQKLALAAAMAAALLTAWVVGCAHRHGERYEGDVSEAPPPESASAAATQPTTAPISGPQAWGDTCGRCHSLRSPTEFSDAQWKVIVHHMRLRANLTGEQQRAITAFLQSAN